MIQEYVADLSICQGSRFLPCLEVEAGLVRCAEAVLLVHMRIQVF